jgi:hypothetical protein
MTVLQKGKAKYPFWGSSINLIPGIDPLGLQVTSEAAYTALLMGIGNLTNKIRYYGFFCWLLKLFFEKEKKGNSTTQARFIRRAELIIAIIMESEHKSVQQIVGSIYAGRILKKNLEMYDIALGADIEPGKSEELYFGNPFGGFGAVYSGQMHDISLIVKVENDDKDVMYNISQPHPRQKVSGRQLADAFESSLTAQIIDLFYNTIKNGKLFKSDFTTLIEYFAIETIDVKSAEWQLYIEMLLDKDEPSQEIEELFTFHRRETIIALLNTSIAKNSEYDWYKYLLTCYENKLGTQSKTESETNVGWYCYQLNEYWQFACGSIFWAVLQHLYGFQQDQYLPTFVKDFSNSITLEICKDLINNADPKIFISEVLSLISDATNEESIKEEIVTPKSSNPVLIGKNGFFLLLLLYKNNKQQLSPLKEFMSRNQMIREGNMADGILTLHKAEHEFLQDFIEQFILRNIIYRHQMVALRKMGNGSQATFKFLIEEQYIRFIDTYPPRNTSPRMNALQNIMSDLQIIDDTRGVTPLHKRLLNVQWD